MLGVFFFVLSAFAVQANAATTLEIGTKEELIRFQKGIQNQTIPLDTNVILTANIDLGGTEWTPIHVKSDDMFLFYQGVFDGGGHTISGLKITKAIIDPAFNALFSGFIARSSGAIMNLTLDGSVDVTLDGQFGYVYTGAICASNSGNITNCTNLCDVKMTFKGTFASEYSYVATGGVAGENVKGVISGCVNKGMVSSTSTAETKGLYTGGILGKTSDSDGKIFGCSNSGSVTAFGYAGGIAGMSYVSLSHCANSGDIESTRGMTWSFGAGGICGLTRYNTIITGCLNEGKIRGHWAGGIAGETTGTMDGCTNRGEVFGSYMAGGIVGCMGEKVNSVTNSMNTATVSCDTGGYAGGIAGGAEPGDKTISNCGYGAGLVYKDRVCGAMTSETTIGTDVKSFDNTLLKEKAVSAVLLTFNPPMMGLTPGTNGNFELMINGTPATAETIAEYGIKVTEEAQTGAEFASIGSFTDGSVSVTAIAQGLAKKVINLTSKCTDFATFGESSAATKDTAPTASTLLAAVREESKPMPPSGSSSSSSGGGCSAGFAALALLAMIPLTLRKKK